MTASGQNAGELTSKQRSSG